MGQYVKAAACIIEVDKYEHRSVLVRSVAESRKGGNDAHAEQHLLDSLYSRLLCELKKTRHDNASQYMILMVTQNMKQDELNMDGSLCGGCVCALNKFQRICGLTQSKLKVITPRMERKDETDDLRSISTIVKIRKRWDDCRSSNEMDFSDVDYVQCRMNNYSSADSNPKYKNGEPQTVEKLIQDECKRKNRREHMQCCHCAEDEKHLFEMR